MNLKGLGAAIALLITNIILYLIYNGIARKILNSKADLKLIQIAILQIVFGIIAMIFIKSDMSLFYYSVPILYMALIFIVEWKMKIITKDDLKYLINFVKIKPLMKYMKEEMTPVKTNEAP